MAEFETLLKEQYDALGAPAGVCDGGDLDCGSGLLLIIRKHFQEIAPGELMEIRSRESSVGDDLPPWCRLVGHQLLGAMRGEGKYFHYLIRKKPAEGAASAKDDLKQDLETARNFVWRTRTKWTGPLAAKTLARNHEIPAGQPASFDTEDPAPAAIELLMSALGGCLAVGFQWRASQKGIEVRNLEISLNAKSKNILVFLGLEESDHPGLSIDGKCYVDADSDADTLKALWAETVKRSPVAQSLARGVKLGIDFATV
jgi:uncharacterized OsmC-like protein/TusA-related sulfurtransferase